MRETTHLSKILNQKHYNSYQDALNRLNKNQKKAVKEIYGPVMVVAGPGTGKTQILAIRAAHILAEADVNPNNILCLTFTEAAAFAMRRRLVKIIGPAAHQAHIYTFHGFCNQVIQDNMSDFGDFRDYEPLSNLEKVKVDEELFDSLPAEHILKSLKSSYAFESGRLARLISLMKTENYSHQEIKRFIQDYYKQLQDPSLESENYNLYKDFYYVTNSKVKGYTKGDKKMNKWQTLDNQMQKLSAAAELLPAYNSILDKKARYDFSDMISWVLEKFESDDEFLGRYQEQYRFIMVDEFQDTNGIQKDLLNKLVSYWQESPNLFVVGDDDQAIYKFQGANLGNISELKDQYNPTIIVLDDNYRSSQKILDATSALINNNNERLVKLNPALTKDLKARRDKVKDIERPPLIHEFKNISQEKAYIAASIANTYERGEKISDIAVICRQHDQLGAIAEILEKKNIPLNVKKKVDILFLPLVKNVLNILTYINREFQEPYSGDYLLFEMMHYPFFEINSHDISLISLARRMGENNKKHYLKDIIHTNKILDTLNLKDTEKIKKFRDLLDKWVGDLSSYTLQVLFQNILNEGGILNGIIKSQDKTWLLQVVRTLFNYLKNETVKNPDLTLDDFLLFINKMKEHKLPLEIQKVMHAEDGLHLVTAHSAKGLEFRKVFLSGANKNYWTKKRGGNKNFSYPPAMITNASHNIEDDRRLFYVAMTRAEETLEISYAAANDDGAKLEAVEFIDEIMENDDVAIRQCKAVDEDIVNDYVMNELLITRKEVELLDHNRIDEVMNGYVLSVTDLTKYLECPLTFYFEKILKVPTARFPHAGYGSAVHSALEKFFSDRNKGMNPDPGQLVAYFENAMDYYRSHFNKEQFRDFTDQGRLTLPEYINQSLSNLDDSLTHELEIKVRNVEYRGIPVTGILDRVDIYQDYVEVNDYKTGKPNTKYSKAKLKRPKDENEIGGEYWRQMVFYKILLDNDIRYNWQMTTGYVDFVEQGNYGQYLKEKFVVTPEDIEIVGKQIEDTWLRIHNHEFSKGCGKEECHWCEFVKDNFS